MSSLLYGAITSNRERSDPATGLRFSTNAPAARRFAVTSESEDGVDLQIFTLVADPASAEDVEGEEDKEDKKASKWLDLAAALVPAEVLAISLTAVALQTDTQAANGDVTFTASTTALTWQFVILMVLPAALFVTGRTTKFQPWDALRAVIPCLAFVAWSLLQTGGMWAAVEVQAGWSIEEGTQFVVAAALVLVLGGITARLATLADLEKSEPTTTDKTGLSKVDGMKRATSAG